MDPRSNRDRRNAVNGHRPRPLAPRGDPDNWDENQVQASRHFHPRGGYFEPEDPNIRSARPAPLRIKNKSGGQITSAERARSQTLQQPASNRVQRHHPYPTPSTARGPEFSSPLVPESNRLRQRPTFTPEYNFNPNPNRNPPVESAPRPLATGRRQIEPLDYLSHPYSRDENRAPTFSHQGVHGFRRPSSSRYPFIPRPQQRSVITQAKYPTQAGSSRKVFKTSVNFDFNHQSLSQIRITANGPSASAGLRRRGQLYKSLIFGSFAATVCGTSGIPGFDPLRSIAKHFFKSSRPTASKVRQRFNRQRLRFRIRHKPRTKISIPPPRQFLTIKKEGSFNTGYYCPGDKEVEEKSDPPDSKNPSSPDTKSPSQQPPRHIFGGPLNSHNNLTTAGATSRSGTQNLNTKQNSHPSIPHSPAPKTPISPKKTKQSRLRRVANAIKNTLNLKTLSKNKKTKKSSEYNIPPEYYARAVADLNKPLFEVEAAKLSDTDSVQPPEYNTGSTQPPEYDCDPARHLADSTMETPLHLDPSSAVAAFSKQKSEAMRLAREQASAVKEMCRRAKSELPPYTFEELIGKGSYGRVYKGRQLQSNSLVAIKVMDIDKLDYKTTRDFRDESIKDFIHETKVMKQVKDSGAKNINMLIESVSIHSQLWLVCEYCPGGSVKTLMRAMDDKLSEKFIIPVARELAEGLNAIHQAGIIHRDIKAANVLIHEEGRLQICDFGVAGVLQSQLDKRSTWIGTPHWMPPELFPNRPTEAHQYGSEVDVWAYGCTIFECVTGNPPNASLRERIQIGRQLNRVPPRLEDGKYSVGVTSLVSYALEADPTTRPSMEDILQHRYIAESAESHPTDSLRELVRIYYQWTQRGGQRISLFNPGGAAAAEIPENRDSLDGETWNFSTTDGFQKRFSLIDLDQITESLAALDGERTPTTTHQPYETPEEDEDTGFTPEQRANFDERVKRGAEAMEGLFDEEKPDYKYETKNDFVPIERNQRNSSDLPLRTDTDRSSVTSTFIDIDLGVYDSARYASAAGATNPPFQLADAGTIRANRSSSRLFRNSSSAGSEPQEDYDLTRGPRPPTMDWTFPAMSTEEEDPLDSEEGGEEEIAPDDVQSREEKRDTRAWTFPVMTEEDGPAEEPNEPERGPLTAWGPGSEGRIEGLSRPFPLQRPPMGRGRNGSDLGPDGDSAVRPTTSASSVSDADTDPFRFDREINQGATLDRVPSLRDFSAGEEEDHGSSLGTAILRNGNFTSYPGVQSESSSIYSSDERGRVFPAGAEGRSPLQFPSLGPPTMESLSEGASEDVIASELDRMFGGFLEGLLATHEAITSADSGRSAGFDQRDNA